MTIITDTDRDVKVMILSVNLLPQVALVDYELTLSMPPALTAAVGVETLTHGIEAYVSRKAHATTDPLALSCIEHVARHLKTAYAEPENHEARAGMMLAACQGGMAFANSSVCPCPRDEPSDRCTVSCTTWLVECSAVTFDNAILMAIREAAIRDYRSNSRSMFTN